MGQEQSSNQIIEALNTPGIPAPIIQGTLRLYDELANPTAELTREAKNAIGSAFLGLSALAYGCGEGPAEAGEVINLADPISRYLRPLVVGEMTAWALNGQTGLLSADPYNLKRMADSVEDWLKEQNPAIIYEISGWQHDKKIVLLTLLATRRDQFQITEEDLGRLLQQAITTVRPLVNKLSFSLKALVTEATQRLYATGILVPGPDPDTIQFSTVADFRNTQRLEIPGDRSAQGHFCRRGFTNEATQTLSRKDLGRIPGIGPKRLDAAEAALGKSFPDQSATSLFERLNDLVYPRR